MSKVPALKPLCKTYPIEYDAQYPTLNIEGHKNDQGKTRLDLLDPYAIEQLGRVLTFGANKYGVKNWTKGIAYSRLVGAALRHLMSFLAGHETDVESGLPHLAHCMCCIMFLLGMSQIHPELDDRSAR
jgi:hypothetical protein